ncbi:hypothetical protein HK096_005913, partial [Nowakowskiella sp. JEL0078]
MIGGSDISVVGSAVCSQRGLIQHRLYRRHDVLEGFGKLADFTGQFSGERREPGGRHCARNGCEVCVCVLV